MRISSHVTSSIDDDPGFFLPFCSRGQGPFEFGEYAFEPSKFGNFDEPKLLLTKKRHGSDGLKPRRK